MKTRNILSLLTALALALSAPAAVAEGLTLTDMAGREITLEAPATRVIALNPADCEILYALGAEDVLVGRGEYCNYPDDVTELPSVNSGAETNIEQILALEPQAIIMSKMAQTVEQVEALEAAGVRVIISDAQDLAGVYDAIAMLGELTGRQEAAAALAEEMQAGFDALREKAEDTGKTVYFEVSPLEWGLWTSGADTFLDELAQIVGLTNAFSDVTGWAEISQEQVLARDPDYIVTTAAYYGEGELPVDEIVAREGWQDLKAVKNDAVYNADADMTSRPGPRLLDAAQDLFDFVYGMDEAAQPAA